MVLKTIAKRFNALPETRKEKFQGAVVNIRENVPVPGKDIRKSLEKAINISCDGVLAVDIELLPGWLFNNDLGMDDCNVGCFYYLASDKESLLLVATKRIDSRRKHLSPFVLSLSTIKSLSVAYDEERKTSLKAEGKGAAQ